MKQEEGNSKSEDLTKGVKMECNLDQYENNENDGTGADKGRSQGNRSIRESPSIYQAKVRTTRWGSYWF